MRRTGIFVPVLVAAMLALSACAGPPSAPEPYNEHSYKMAGHLTEWMDRTHGRPAQ